MAPINRKASVQQIDALNRLGLIYDDSGTGGVKSPPRPFVGGVNSGFHSMPTFTDKVLVLHEKDYYPAAAVSVTDHPEKLTSLKPGESAIYATDGRELCFLKADGSTVLYRNAAGVVLISVDAAGNITVAATPTVSITASTAISMDAPAITMTTPAFDLDTSGAVELDAGTTLTATAPDIALDATTSIVLDAASGTVSIKSPLVLTNQVVGGFTGTIGYPVAVIGIDPQGGTVSSTGTASISYPATLSLSINGTTHIVPLLS